MTRSPPLAAAIGSTRRLAQSSFLTVSVIALAVLPLSAKAANLLTNGSFEDTTNFVPDGRDTDTLPVGSTALTGWTVAGSHALAWIGPTNPFALTASNGSYFLDLTGDFSGAPYSAVQQTVATNTGGNYTLTFDLGSSSTYGIPDGITASAAATSMTFTSTVGGTNNFQTETLNFVATGPSTTISLFGASGRDYIGLDNVNLSCVSNCSSTSIPEPATIVLLGAGLFGLGLTRRKAV